MPDIGQPSASDKNSDAEIRDAIVSDATRFRGGFIDERLSDAGAPVAIVGQFQLNTATFVQSFSVRSQSNNPRGITFSPDGSQMYFTNGTGSSIFQYSLSSAFDVTSASFDTSVTFGGDVKVSSGVALKPDGTEMYLTDENNNDVTQFSLSTAFDVSSASVNQVFSSGINSSNPTGLVFRPDGSRLYIVGTGSDDVDQYTLSTPYDISTASFDVSFSVGTQDSIPTGVHIRPDGNQLYMVGRGGVNVYQYTLSTSYDVSTAAFDKSFDVSTQDSLPRGVTFEPNGSQMYVTGNGSDRIYQYAVGTIGSEVG